MAWRDSTEDMMQNRAIRAYMEHGVRSPEYVALIIGYRWFELDNQLMFNNAGSSAYDGMADGAFVDSEGVGAFQVSDEDVRSLLEYADSLGLSGWQAMLWHSHIQTQEPSAHDLTFLPDWCSSGLIFHVPSRVTTPYKHAESANGLMHSGSSNPTLATGGS